MLKKKKRASIKDKDVEFNKKLIDEMLRLATSGFGLVAALSWNNLIQSAIKQYYRTNNRKKFWNYFSFYLRSSNNNPSSYCDLQFDKNQKQALVF